MSQEEYLRDQNEGLKNKVKSLEDEIRYLQWEKNFLTKQVEHLQSCFHCINKRFSTCFCKVFCFLTACFVGDYAFIV